MIHLNRSASFEASLPTIGSRRENASSARNFNNSFAQQIASALQGYFSGSDSPSHIEIAIDAQPGQNSGTRQFIVTVKDTGSAPSAPANPAVASLVSSTPATPAEPPVIQSMMVTGVVQYVPPKPSTEPPPIKTEADAYWAQQPAEVQQLRTIQNYDERRAKAQELASKGFSIDTEIQVFGYDPYMTMKYREDSGFTWIPAAGQPNIPLAPGLSFPGLPQYDPKNPPPGSIKVSTAFAKGFEETIPFWGVTANTPS